MNFESIPNLPVVGALPAAGTIGRLVTLSTDGHVYHDNGSSWDDVTQTGGGGASDANRNRYSISADTTIPANYSIVYPARRCLNGATKFTNSGVVMIA